MKKVIISLTIIVFIILAGWILKDITTLTSNASEDNGDRFVVIENKNYLYQIVYDRETKVQYAISRGSYNQGTFYLLVDADGKPLLYKGE